MRRTAEFIRSSRAVLELCAAVPSIRGPCGMRVLVRREWGASGVRVGCEWGAQKSDTEPTKQSCACTHTHTHTHTHTYTQAHSYTVYQVIWHVTRQCMRVGTVGCAASLGAGAVAVYEHVHSAFSF